MTQSKVYIALISFLIIFSGYLSLNTKKANAHWQCPIRFMGTTNEGCPHHHSVENTPATVGCPECSPQNQNVFIINVLDEDRCLSLSSLSSREVGLPVVTAGDCHPLAAKWQIRGDSLINLLNGSCLTSLDAIKAANNPVVVTGNCDQSNSRWEIKGDHHIVNLSQRGCLASIGPAQLSNGVFMKRPVVIAGCDKSNAQWRITR